MGFALLLSALGAIVSVALFVWDLLMRVCRFWGRCRRWRKRYRSKR